MQREGLGSRLGFILISAGCAIGIGNVWKFPYICGQYGGGIFVLIYLLFLVILGIPVMTMEFAMGRASRKSPAKLYQQLEPAGSKWHIHGGFAVAGNYILMMFYTTVCGWMLHYCVSTASGAFVGLDADAIAGKFSEMLASPGIMAFYAILVCVAGFVVIAFGVQKGLERVTKYMMLALLAIMIVLALNSCFLPGGQEGLEFYLKPDINKLLEAGVWNVVIAAMNQSFFTLSLGIGAMAIFGSYINKERALLGESLNVAILDTFVALCAGLIIFPACSAFGVQADSGPNLLFITLPNIFNNMTAGRVWGTLFFVFMSFAALSTVLAVFENIVASCCEAFGWSRKKACVINGVAMIFLSLPCVLGFNLWSGAAPFGEGSTIMDLEDFAVSNILLPLGSFLFVVFCTARKGWGWDNFVAEANAGKGLKVRRWMRPYMTYVLPSLIFVLLIIGLYNFFA